jgi:integrase
MAAAGVPLRMLQEWMGHRDYKTTLIYADYAPAGNEVGLVNTAFSLGSSAGASHTADSAAADADDPRGR